MSVSCGTLVFNLFQFDGLHFCFFGGEFILHYYGIILMLGAIAGAWNSLPDGMKTLLVGGFAANKAVKGYRIGFPAKTSPTVISF